MLTSEEINKAYRSFVSWLVKNRIYFMYYNNYITVISRKEHAKYDLKKLDTYDNKWEVTVYNRDGVSICRTYESSSMAIKRWLLELKKLHFWEDN